MLSLCFCSDWLQKNKTSSALIFALCLVSASLPVHAVDPPGSSVGASADDQDPKKSLEHFVIKLFLDAAQLYPETNFTFSPESFIRLIYSLFMGASGETQQLLASFLADHVSQLSASSQSDTQEGASAMAADTYFSETALLLSSEYRMQENYIHWAEQQNMQVWDGVDFTNRDSVEVLVGKLNAYICEVTHGIYPSLCHSDQFNENTALAILNTVYFKGLWQHIFSRENINKESKREKEKKKGRFTLANGQAITLDRVMTNQLRHIRGTRHSTQYGELNHWQAVSVPYRGDHEMVLILPPEGTALAERNPEILTSLLASMQPGQMTVSLTLPPFEARSTTGLPLLEQTGLGGLLPGINLENMFKGGSADMMLGLFQQDCAIKVDELGTEAVAATRAAVVSMGVSIPLHFNRPFLYLVRHRETGMILFIGQVYDPRTSGQ